MRETSRSRQEVESERMRKYRHRRWGKSLKKTSSFLAAGARELEGVNQRLGAQRDTAQTKREMRRGIRKEAGEGDVAPATAPRFIYHKSI